MQIADVQDVESLERYLDALPEDQRVPVARRIAFYAAARVLPVAARYFAENPNTENPALTAAPVFGALSISGAAMMSAAPLIAAAADAAAATDAVRSAVRLSSDAASDAAFVVARSADAAVAAYAAIPVSVAASVAADVAADAAAAADASALAEIWKAIHADLTALQADPLAPLTGPWDAVPQPDSLRDDWAEACRLMRADKTADWSFWIAWYDRVLAGRDTLPDEMAKVLNKLDIDDWKKGPAHINPLFDGVLGLYREQDAAGSGRDAEPRRAAHVATVKAQVVALQEFVDAEYRNLSGHNARTPVEDDLLEVLRQLKALVDEMMRCFEAAGDDGQALVTIQENLPAVVEKTGELAVIEPAPEISANVVAMSAIIKTLTDSGADPRLATQIAMAEVAGKKVKPGLMRMFRFTGFGRKDDT